ncbi:MAG: PhoH family protein [Halomonas sp.]|uniref:PhoH family protein n=1 Tax=Halomonas sp. TaxID=1486246 RepID=UPI003F8FA0CD
MVHSNDTRKRFYVLDTSVLLHDPAALYQFGAHDVVIPMSVLEALDKHKVSPLESARAARQISHTLSELTASIDLSLVHNGIPLPHPDGSQGRLRLLYHAEMIAHDDAVEPDTDKRVLDESCHLRDAHPDAIVTLVSRDITRRIKAAALGIAVEYYRRDRAYGDSDAMLSGCWTAPQTPQHADSLWPALELEATVDQHDGKTRYQLSGQIPQAWHPGMLVTDGSTTDTVVREISATHATLETLTDYRSNASVWGIHAHDSRQNFALNLLMDERIDLITLAGSAGTGKTFMTLAAALQQTLESQRFKRVVFTRTAIAMSEDIGYLPGSEEEKMGPWMGAFHDNMASLLRDEESGNSTWDEAATHQLLGSKLQIRAPGYMRGRTLEDTFLIIDEAQNFTPAELKSLITRAGRNTKIVCLGNVGQIDTPWLAANTCGLAAVAQRFRDWPHAGHITLTSVRRSRLAQAGEELL